MNNPRYTCKIDRANNTQQCVPSSHGISLESCNNICNSNLVDYILPVIKVARPPLKEIIYSIFEWWVPSSVLALDESFVEYPFNDKYRDMFYGSDPELVYNFLKFITKKRLSINLIYNLIKSRAREANNEYYNIDNIKGDINNKEYVIELEIYENDSKSLNAHIVSEIAKNDEYTFLAKIHYYTSYIKSDPIYFDNTEVVKTITRCLNEKHGIHTIMINNFWFDSFDTKQKAGAHANILIFNTNTKNIYYIEPHGTEYPRITIFIAAFKIIFLKKYNEWQIHFVPHNIQNDDPFCASWSTLCASIIRNNPHISGLESIMLLFSDWKNNINILLIWYFSLYESLSNYYCDLEEHIEYMRYLYKQMFPDGNILANINLYNKFMSSSCQGFVLTGENLILLNSYIYASVIKLTNDKDITDVVEFSEYRDHVTELMRTHGSKPDFKFK